MPSKDVPAEQKSGLIEEFDIKALREKVQSLSDQGKDTDLHRSQELAIAFCCGMLSLVAMLGFGKVFARTFLARHPEGATYSAVHSDPRRTSLLGDGQRQVELDLEGAVE